MKQSREAAKAILHNDVRAGVQGLDRKMTRQIAEAYRLRPADVLEVLLPLVGKENESGSTLASNLLRFVGGEWRVDERGQQPGKAYLHYQFFYT